MNPDQIAAFINSRLSDGDQRMDAAETAHVAKSLEAVKAKTYDVVYDAFKARRFIPVDTSAGPAADSIVYYQWDMFGMAKIVANYADDLPMADAISREFSTPVRSVGASYQYSIQDMRRAAKTGSQLDQRRANAARRSIEAKIDDVGALGDSAAGLTGFANNANVPLTPPITGGWSIGVTAANLALGDLHELVGDTFDAGRDMFNPNTVILGSSAYKYAVQTHMSVDNTTTVLNAFLRESPWITDMDVWHKLDTAGAGATTRAICYRRDPEVLTLEIPQDFEQFPPEARGLAFVVATHARVGGTVIRYPLAVRYMDGL